MSSTPITSALTLVQLQCFLAIVDHGSFAAAGRQLGLSTSAVSKTISRLEQAHAIRLLNRSTHALSLTPEGERLLPSVREAVSNFKAVEFAMSDVSARSADGKVRISAPTAFLSAFIAPLMTRFRAEHPGILLELRGSDAMDDLADEGIDLALRTGRINGVPGHLRQSWFRFPWMTCASPGYLAAHGAPTTLEDLAHHNLIGFRNRGTGLVDPWRYRTSIWADGTTIRWNPNPVLILDDANAVRAAAVEGAGVIWSPSWLVVDDIRAGRLQQVLGELPPTTMEMSIIRRAQVPTPERTALVIAFLQMSARTLA
jgi:DNA-binding transcriptional LysR family regulator